MNDMRNNLLNNAAEKAPDFLKTLPTINSQD